MRKILLAAGVLLTILAILPAAKAGDDWEWWFTTPVSYKLDQDVKVDAEGLFRWKNDMKDIYYRSGIAGGSYSLCPWVSVGAHFWYKEVRKAKGSPWVYTDTYVGNLDFQHQAADWLVLKENNRIEYDNEIYKWTLRVKPRLDFPLVWLGLKPVTLFLEDELFFKFETPGQDTFSENRVTAGATAKVLGPFGVTVAYRNVGKKAAYDQEWSYTNVLVTSARLSF